MKNERMQKHKPLSNYEIEMFGISPQKMFVDTADELRKNPPNIIIAEATRDMPYRQNNYQGELKILKKVNYVTALQFISNCVILEVIITIKYSSRQNSNFRNYINLITEKILLIRLFSYWSRQAVGIFSLFSPNLRYIKEKYPTSKIIFACGPQYQSMVGWWKFIGQLIDLPFTIDYLSNLIIILYLRE